MDYTELKYAILGEFKSFDEYAKLKEKTLEKLVHERFNKMHNNMMSITKNLSVEEMDELITRIRKDDDVPEAVEEIVAGIGLIKIAQRHNGIPFELLLELALHIDRGGRNDK